MKQLVALFFLSFALSAYGDGGMFGKEPSAQAITFGALGYDPNTHAWAYAIKTTDKARATAVVARLCGKDCAVYGPFDACGVVVSNAASSAYGEGLDRASAEADARAKAKCVDDSCEVAVWGCNTLASAEGFGYRHETSHPKNFGAIAYDSVSGAFGTVWDMASFADAVAVAKGNCGKECRVYVAQGGDCGVLAKGDSSVAVGSGADFKAAEGMALAKCGNGSCKTHAWFCNSQTK